MDEIKDINKRILENRYQTEKLKAELQDLINEGLGKTAKVQVQDTDAREVKDPSLNKFQITKAFDGQCSSQIAKKEKVSQIHPKACQKKVKTYNVEEAREYIKKQRLKRFEQLKSSSKENKVQIEIKQQKLQELHKKAIELVQKNVDAKRRARSKSRERTGCIRPDIDRLPRSKSASKISSVKNLESRLQPKNEVYQDGVKEDLPQGTISKNEKIPKCKVIKVLQNITLTGPSDSYQKQSIQNPETVLSPRDIKQDVHCDSMRVSKETQTTKPEKHFPKWLQETPVESSPHNVINTFRKKLEFAASCPKLNVDVGVQNSICNRTLQDLPELKLSAIPKCLNLDPKTVEHIELKPASPSLSNPSGSESDTSKNIPEISSESGTTLKKMTESAKNNVPSDISFSINTYKIDNMQLKKSRTITIKSDPPVVIITDENGYSFDHQRLEDRKNSIISSGSPEGQGFRCSKNKTSSSIKTDPHGTPTHSKNIPNSDSKYNKSKCSDNRNKSYSQKSPSQLSKADSQEHKNSKLRKNDHAHNLQRPYSFVNTRRGSGSDSALDDFFETDEKSETLVSDSDVNTDISHTNQSKVEVSSVKTTSVERNLDMDAAAEIMPLKEPTASLSTINKNRMIHDDNKSRVLKNICVRTNRQDENPNEIHLKFEAEIHLLNDFNESLRQFVEVEKAFETLKNNSVNKKCLATKDTQTSVKSLDNSDCHNKENSIISSVNYSRGSLSEAPFNYTLENSDSSVVLTGFELSNMEISQKSSSIKSYADAVDLINNGDDHVTKMSLNLFEQLIKDEDARLENLKTILKIREQALLDRTKGELAWLEIQRKHLKETGKFQEASTIKKKQRGILLNLQKEKNEMQRLKQIQKAASAERKTVLKEQSRQLRKNLVTTNMSQMKINTPRQRRLSGPIKVIQSKTESIRSETSMSRISSTDREKEVYSIASRQSIVSRVSEFSEFEVSSKAIESEVENKQTSIKRNLLMKEAALSKRRKAAEELLQCHQKLLEEEKRVVALESMAKSIICPKNDATKKRKTWSVPAPISVPKQSEKTSVEYASDFEVESIMDAVDQNIKDLMSDFSKVQDNISMLGISKSSKSDEDENKEEENSVIETKKPNKNSTGTISSISSSVSASVVPDISERLSKTFCARTSEAPSQNDSELQPHTIREERSVVPEVSEKISSSLIGALNISASKTLSSPKSDEKYSSVPDVSERNQSNNVSNASASKVSAHISERVVSRTGETNSVPEWSEKTKSIDDGLGISVVKISQRITSKHSSQDIEKTGTSDKISDSPSEGTNISDRDRVVSYESSAISEIADKPLKSQGTIKTVIASESKTSIELSEEILNSLQGQNNTSNTTNSAACLHRSDKALPEIANLSDSPKTKANSHLIDEILSGKDSKTGFESMTTDEVSIGLLNSAQGQSNILKISNSAGSTHRSNETLSKKSSDKVSVVSEVLKKQTDLLLEIEDLSDTSKTNATSYSSDKIVSGKMASDEAEEILNLLQGPDVASKMLNSDASTHRSDKSLPEKGSKEDSIVAEVVEKLSDSLPEISDLSDSAKTKATLHSSEEILSMDSIKKTSVVPGRSLKVSKAIKVNNSIKSIAEVIPKCSAEVLSDRISEMLSEVERDDSQKLIETGASQTLSNISSAELNEDMLATVANDILQGAEVDFISKSSSNKTSVQVKMIGKVSETLDNKVLLENETNDTHETPPSEVNESILGASEVTQGLHRVPKVNKANESSKVSSSEAPAVSKGVLSENGEEEIAPKSKISGIIEAALQEVYGMDETLYKHFKRDSAEATTTEKSMNESVGINKCESINQDESVKISKAEQTLVSCGSESISEQFQNGEKAILKNTGDSVEASSKTVEGIPGSEECFTSEADRKTNEKSIAVENEDKGFSRAEFGESELKDIISKAVKEGLFSVLESATNLNSALDRSVSEHFPKTAEEHKSTGLHSKSAGEINVPYAIDETDQISFIEHLDSHKETDIDEELSLDASEEHNIITSLTISDKDSGTSISKSSSNRGVLDLSYGALDTSFTKEEINSYEEKEQDSLSPQNDEDPANVEGICSVVQESVKSVDVKKRVSEIMADANLTRGDKSPRLQDIYTTTYDLASPANSPEYGSPINVNKTTAPVSIFGEEAEEIFKKQLAIEQEIKAITEQQQKEQQVPFLFVREIPNKPPPPYTPPSSLPPIPPVQPIVPTRDEIDEITKYASKILYKAHLGGKLDKVTISDSTLNLIGTTISKDRYRFVFDLCKEICRWHYGQFEESTCPSWLKITRKPKLAVEKPLDASGLEKHMTKKLRELYGYEKPIIRENAIIKWCKKKRNHIDEILISESLQEESQWTNFEKDDRLVMDQVTNEVMNMLLIKETEEIFRNVFCRKIL